jgi:hypothetical protein
MRFSPDAHGILFGFPASRKHPGRNLPGQTVFTCLSHDTIAHETTHAIVDGIREFFMEPTNIDVPAFHEAFVIWLHCSPILRKNVLLTHCKRLAASVRFCRSPKHRLVSTRIPRHQAQIAKANPLIAGLCNSAKSGMRGDRSALGTCPNSMTST